MAKKIIAEQIIAEQIIAEAEDKLKENLEQTISRIICLSAVAGDFNMKAPVSTVPALVEDYVRTAKYELVGADSEKRLTVTNAKFSGSYDFFFDGRRASRVIDSYVLTQNRAGDELALSLVVVGSHRLDLKFWCMEYDTGRRVYDLVSGKQTSVKSNGRK